MEMLETFSGGSFTELHFSGHKMPRLTLCARGVRGQLASRVLLAGTSTSPEATWDPEATAGTLPAPVARGLTGEGIRASRSGRRRQNEPRNCGQGGWRPRATGHWSWESFCLTPRFPGETQVCQECKGPVDWLVVLCRPAERLGAAQV